MDIGNEIKEIFNLKNGDVSFQIYLSLGVGHDLGITQFSHKDNICRIKISPDPPEIIENILKQSFELIKMKPKSKSCKYIFNTKNCKRIQIDYENLHNLNVELLKYDIFHYEITLCYPDEN